MRLHLSSAFRSLLTLLIWALLGWALVYWGSLILEPVHRPQAAPMAEGPQVRAQAISSWLAAPASPPQPELIAPSRFNLLGVIAEGRGGVAVIALDGQPPRPYRVGAVIAEGVVLRAVGPRYAELAADRTGPVSQRLELPPAPAPDVPAGLAFGARAPAR